MSSSTSSRNVTNHIGSGSAKFGEVHVLFGKETLRVPLPPPASPLSALKDTLYNITGVSPALMKLIHNGAILKDDLMTLERYALIDWNAYEDDIAKTNSDDPKSSEERTSFWENWLGKLSGGSSSSGKMKRDERKIPRVVMIGNKRVVTEKESQEAMWARRKIPVEEIGVNQSEERVPETEGQVQEKIGTLLGTKVGPGESKMIELKRGVEQLEQRVNTTTPTVPEDANTSPTTKVIPPHLQSAQLSESLIQLLLALDSISIDSAFSEARKERKEGVRVVQDLLDRVDAIREELKRRIKAGL